MRAQRAYVLCLLGALLLVLALAPAAWSLTWDGGSASSPSWSLDANWVGAPPSLSEPFRLEFPRLPQPTCASVSPSETCYVSKNDVGNVAVESLRVDDGDEYELEGDGITLGSEGLTASPASGSSGPSGDFIGLPIELGVSQAWGVAGRSGGGIGENGLFVEGALTGLGKSLAVTIENGAALYLHNDTEVGSLTFAGANTGVPGALNGFVGLLGAQVNSSDGNAVALSHIFMLGSGSVGALTTSDAELGVSSGHPTGGIQAGSATFDAGSEVEFEITDAGTVADSDYGQLSSSGPITLGGATIGVFVAPTSGTSCPTPSPGLTYTLVSTTSSLSGSFGNAPEGTEIPVRFSKSCAMRPSVNLRIAYHRSGGTQTMTGTVLGSSGVEIPNPENPVIPFEDKAPSWVAESAGQRAAYAVSLARAQEEAERLARAAQQPATPPTIALLASNLAVQSNGVGLVKLQCAGGASGENCAGRLTLSARAVSKGRKRSHATTIATAGFSIAIGKTASVRVKLNGVGRALLRKGHGRLTASLTILQSAPATHTQTSAVHLRQQTGRRSR